MVSHLVGNPDIGNRDIHLVATGALLVGRPADVLQTGTGIGRVDTLPVGNKNITTVGNNDILQVIQAKIGVCLSDVTVVRS
jgi:hypothetical protein